MGMGIADPDFSLFQVPEFFVTDIGKMEMAGGDCVRVFQCIRRGNELIPVSAVVMPINCLREAAVSAKMQADKLFKEMHALAS